MILSNTSFPQYNDDRRWYTKKDPCWIKYESLNKNVYMRYEIGSIILKIMFVE